MWRGDYWKGKHKSPWFLTLVVLFALWAYGHVNGGAAKDSTHPGPSSSASASPGHGGTARGTHDAGVHPKK